MTPNATPKEPGLSNDGIVPVTCLGCGCTCDDVRLTLTDGAITALHPACPIASAWAGTGQLPTEARIQGTSTTRDAALDAAAAALGAAGSRLLVVLAPGLPTDTYGDAVAIADLLGAAVETPHGTTATDWLLAGQRRGRPLATLGETRHRTDCFVYWGVDPAATLPRFAERYGERSHGLHADARTVVGVSIGTDRAAAGPDLQLTLAPDEELAALGAMRAVLRDDSASVEPHLQGAVDLVRRLAASKYITIIASTDDGDPARSPARTEALLALAQQLNGPTSRCALTVLRPGGNVAGIESLLLWQTGFPMAVDFASGAPAFAPAQRGSTRGDDAFAAVLVVGDLTGLPAAVRDAALAVPHVVIGPRASACAPAAAASIDTGIAGLHEAGTAYRMDDVPIPVDAVLPHPHPSAGLVAALRKRLMRMGVAG